MFSMDLIYRARWHELYSFFASGEPPLVMKLLIINTIVLMLFIFRQARSKHPMRAKTAFAVQVVLILGNFFVMFQNDLMPAGLQLKPLF